MTDQPRESGVERFLNLFTDVRPGEAKTALLLALNVFLILTSYYMLKTVREALILGEGSAELKSYLSAGQVVVLAFAVPYYGRLVAAYPRIKLINVVTVFFIACPVVFYLLAQARVPLGMIYFVWIGVFNLMIVAQFWSFANDVYSKDEGERLLVIVGLGASLGAVAGAGAAARLIAPVGVLQLMLLGAGVLGLQLLLTNHIDRAERGRRPSPVPRQAKKAAPNVNAFAMVFRTRYLLLIAVMLLMANWINTTGEYILGSIVKEHATAMVAAGTAPGLSEGQIIGDFYAKYFTWVNAIGLLLQLFVVSRIVKHRGVAWAVMVLPALSFGVYNVLMFVPVLSAVLAAKVVENSTDYSLNNTVRNMLFLPCTYEQKFAAKQAIDSFFVRMGDVLSAVLVFVGTSLVILPTRGFAAVNAVLAVVLLSLAWRVGRHYNALTAKSPAPAAAAGRPAEVAAATAS
jgi:ATP:ADP antiporter, AAA family